jgi:hypothetical protein
MAIKKTVTKTPMSHYAPPADGISHPADNPKVQSKGGYTFFKWPNFDYLGGAQQAFSQMGSKKTKAGDPGPGQDATGPISDRGKGGRQ